MEDFDTLTHAQGPQEPLEEGLARLSLIQTLRDFEVANGRVIDLTERLVVTAEELLAAREELDAIRAERDGLKAQLAELANRHEALRETLERTMERKSVKLGQAIWDARRLVPSRRRDG